MGQTDNAYLLHQVREAWADVLGLDAVDAVPLDINFLEAGGDSLLLVMLWEQLYELTDHVLKMSDLFHHGTVRAQAALLADGEQPRLASTGTKDRRQLLGRAKRPS